MRALLTATSLALVVTTTFAMVSQSLAQEIRIETEVFSEDDAETPLSHTVTLFDTNTVYDFVEAPEQIAVFRAPTPNHGGQFILLDINTQCRTEISTERIGKLIDKITKWAADEKDPLMKFSADPKFEEAFDEETGLLSLTSKLWEYHVATVPAENPKALAKYREFIDWYTRLNTMMNSSPPPGPRLELNSALEKHGVVPVEIRRTLTSNKSTLRAVHTFTWRLSREDKVRLEEVRKHLANFRKVEPAEFLAAKYETSDVVRGQSE